MKAMALERPRDDSADATTILLEVTAPDGAILGKRILPHGSRHRLTPEEAAELLGAGVAHALPKLRYLATETLVSGTQVLARGEIFETVDGVDPALVQSGRLILLAPGQDRPASIPDGPGDALERVFWRKGPRVRVEALKPGKLEPGVWASVAGEVHEIRESNAVWHAFHKAVRVLDALSPAGRAYLAYLHRPGDDPDQRIKSYEDFARVLARAQPKLAAADAGPPCMARVACGYGLMIGDKKHRPGEDFKAPEAMLAYALFAGQIVLLDRPTDRFTRYLAALRRFRMTTHTIEPHPVY